MYITKFVYKTNRKTMFCCILAQDVLSSAHEIAWIPLNNYNSFFYSKIYTRIILKKNLGNSVGSTREPTSI